jgi:hypothetical protein
VAREATLSARLAFSCLASLAFSSALIYQDRAPSRVAQSRWSRGYTKVSAVSLSAAATCTVARSLRAFCSASSHATSAALTMSTAEAHSAVCAPWSRSSFARPEAGTPATRCRSVGPSRGRRGSRTGPSTSRARSSTEQGDHPSTELDPPAPVASS